MGQSAIDASQSAIQTTGNNISNANTEGYSRQKVRFEAMQGINFYPGQIGQGVATKEIYRCFDKFSESAYLSRSTMQNRYERQQSLMSQLDSMFNESGDYATGLSTSMSTMFNSWNTLAKDASSSSSREALLQSSLTLTSLFRSTHKQLEEMQTAVDTLIQQDVTKANTLIQEIAEINKQLNKQHVAGTNNANNLMDKRDEAVRELAKIIDITVHDNGGGDYVVTTKAGQMLVQLENTFALEYGGKKTDKALVNTSTFTGDIEFTGTDSYEYTIEVTQHGFADDTGASPPPPGTAMYKVSLDGGKTWLTDENGNVKEFPATNKKNSTTVKDLSISFTSNSALSKGDSFVISPKNDVFWQSPTSGPVNISTQIFGDGTDNGQRITGGSLAGHLAFRDNQVGQVKDRLNDTAKTLIWEVNRLHSQGSGLEKLLSAYGTQRVERVDVPLGSPSADLPWSDRLQSGNLSFAIYDVATGKAVIGYPGVSAFSPENFDPSKHTLQDVVTAINSTSVDGKQFFNASIVDGKLNIEMKEPGKYSFGITNDTTGLAAALGINTFFTGSDASDMGIRTDITTNTNLINAGAINGAGEANAGDNAIATAIAKLSTQSITIKGRTSTTQQSITDFYASLVSRVGSETAKTTFSYKSEKTMTAALKEQKEQVSGVSIDEELMALIKYQSSYKAAAKVVTTADQMLQTLLSLKQ